MKKTGKKKQQSISQKRQWGIVAGLIVLLFVFAVLVFVADGVWRVR